MAIHNRDKYPEIWAAFEKARAKKAAIMEARKPHIEASNKLQLEIEELKLRQAAAINLAYVDLEELREVSKDVSRLARAMGASTLAAELPG